MKRLVLAITAVAFAAGYLGQNDLNAMFPGFQPGEAPGLLRS
jgi:hypothetical protein